jgi:hypothetical protein
MRRTVLPRVAQRVEPPQCGAPRRHVVAPRRSVVAAIWWHRAAVWWHRAAVWSVWRRRAVTFSTTAASSFATAGAVTTDGLHRGSTLPSRACPHAARMLIAATVAWSSDESETHPNKTTQQTNKPTNQRNPKPTNKGRNSETC